MTHVMLASTCDLLAFCDFDREEIRAGEDHLGDRHLPQARGSFKWHVLCHEHVGLSNGTYSVGDGSNRSPSFPFVPCIGCIDVFIFLQNQVRDAAAPPY